MSYCSYCDFMYIGMHAHNTSRHQRLPSLLRQGTLQDQIVMTPSLSAVGMETKQLTEENADFALRDRYHHSSFITTTDKMVHPQSN